jgi:hypothetical protein
MLRTFAMVSMAVMCMAPGTLLGAALAQEAGYRAPAAVVNHDAPPTPQQHISIGCIGFHGTGSGHAVNGRCTASRAQALGSPSRGGYEAYGAAPSGGYRYPDGARSASEEQLIQTTQHPY